MQTLQPSLTTNIPSTNIQRIAIVDDDKDAVDVAIWQVEDAGFEAFVVEKSFQEVNDLALYIMENAQGALCDHRLAQYALAPFPGSKLVAALYDKKIPSILITQYVETDTAVSIRMYRQKIPVLLSRDEANASTIKKGIEDCVSELNGRVPSTRRAHRTLLNIIDITHDSEKEVVDVIVPGWNPHRAVRFPTLLIPEELHAVLKPDGWLFARINTGAEKAEDLFFDQFEIAPELDDDDGLA